MECEKPEWILRRPTVDDAATIWQLVREAGILDENSLYAYLLLCRDFAETCLVAEHDARLVAFVTGYRPPGRSDSLFVWQIGVHASFHRRGLGLRLLLELVRNCQSKEPRIQFVEATIASSNVASRRLFHRLADHLGAPLHESVGFTEEHFHSSGHEAEPVIRIGPF